MQNYELVAVLMIVLGVVWIVLAALGFVFRGAILDFAARRYARVELERQRESVGAAAMPQRVSKVALTVIAAIAVLFGVAACAIGSTLL